MVLTQLSGNYLPCYEGGGSCNKNCPSIGCNTCFSQCVPGSIVQMEKLISAVQGYHDPRQKERQERMARAAAAHRLANTLAENRIKNCCKDDYTMVSKLLQKLKDINVPTESTSLTCIIFTELCKLSSINPKQLPAKQKAVTLLVAKKLGAWIGDMMEKKCANIDMTIYGKGLELLAPVTDKCSCLKPKPTVEETKLGSVTSETIDGEVNETDIGKTDKKTKNGKKKKMSYHRSNTIM